MPTIARPDLIGLLRRQDEVSPILLQAVKNASCLLKERPTLENLSLTQQISEVAQAALQDLLKFQIPNFTKKLDGNLLTFAEADQASFLAWQAIVLGLRKTVQDLPSEDPNFRKATFLLSTISYDEHWLPLLSNYPKSFFQSSQMEPIQPISSSEDGSFESEQPGFKIGTPSSTQTPQMMPPLERRVAAIPLPRSRLAQTCSLYCCTIV